MKSSSGSFGFVTGDASGAAGAADGESSVAGPAVLPRAATGLGSLPGTDIDEAVAVVAGEWGGFPYLPELPARGPHAGLIGRSAAHLVDLHVDLQPAGWRLITRSGLDERRARGLLVRDLDALEIGLYGHRGPVKVQVAGPWTLVAGLSTPTGRPALADPGAVADVAASLAQGVADLVADVRRRLSPSEIWVQLDEPTMPAALAGALPTASGLNRLRAVDEATATAYLQTVITAIHLAGARVLVHCCHPEVPVGLIRQAGADALAIDATLLRRGPVDDALAAAVEAGAGVVLGVVPSVDPPLARRPRVDGLLGDARRVLDRWGVDPGTVAGGVSVGPTCGLAGATSAWARRAARLSTRVAEELLGEAQVPGGER